jgi:hypothetical protein
LALILTADVYVYLAGFTDFDCELLRSPNLDTQNMNTDIWISIGAHGGCDRSAGDALSPLRHLILPLQLSGIRVALHSISYLPFGLWFLLNIVVLKVRLSSSTNFINLLMLSILRDQCKLQLNQTIVSQLWHSKLFDVHLYGNQFEIHLFGKGIPNFAKVVMNPLVLSKLKHNHWS